MHAQHLQKLFSIKVFALTFICIAIFTSMQIPIAYDGNTFIQTARRFANGEFNSLYSPIPGSGPYTYLPYASIFFVPLAWTANNLNFLAALSFLSLMYTANTVASQNLTMSRKSGLFAMGVIAIMFGSIIGESLYIGQIDLILLALLTHAFVKETNITISCLLFSIVTVLKPQFFIFYLLYLNNNKFFKPLIYIILVHFFLASIFLIFLDFDFPLFKHLFVEFTHQASSISSTIDVTNQSLVAILKRLWGDNQFQGRYFPTLFAGGAMNIHNTYLSIYVTLCFITSLCLVAYKLITRFKYFRKSLYVFHALLATLPIISPLFWQVHAVYLIPIVMILAQNCLKIDFQKGSNYVWVALIASTNPIIVGGEVADFFLGLGATCLFAIICVYILLAINNKSLQNSREQYAP